LAERVILVVAVQLTALAAGASLAGREPLQLFFAANYFGPAFSRMRLTPLRARF
jgi:hypothetical protein